MTEDERSARLLRRILWICTGIAALHLVLNWLVGDRPGSFYVLLVAVSGLFGALALRVTVETLPNIARIFVGTAMAAVIAGGLLQPSILPYVVTGGLVVVIIGGSMVGARAALLLGGALVLAEVAILIGSEAGVIDASASVANTVVLILETGTGAGLVALLSLSRRRAVEAQKEEQDRLAAIIEQSPDALVSMSESGILLSVSPAIERVLGFDARLLADKALAQTALASLVPSAAPTEGPVWLERHDGSLVAVEVNGRWVSGQDGERVWRATLRDVTARARAEEERALLLDQLNHAQRLDAVGRLAGGVAHDFNNLLTVVLASSAELTEDLRDAEHLELVSEIEEAALRATQLTRQLLQFSRRETVQPATFDLCESVPQLGRLLRRMLGAMVTLTIDCHPDPCLVHMDPGQIEQVLINLALNARDSMAEGGSLHIEVRPADEATVRVSVQDEGAGVAEDVLPRLFEPFFTTKGPSEGTGLGLAVVHGIVTSVGGSIEVSSEVGVGTRFEIVLPLAEGGREPRRVSDVVPTIDRAGTRVLVIEDEPMVLATIRRALERAGCSVVSAETRDGALRAFEEGAVDVVLSDVVLPGESGPSIVEHVEADHGPQTVVFMTGYSGGALDRALAERPGLRLLPKPFSPKELLRTIEEARSAGLTTVRES